VVIANYLRVIKVNQDLYESKGSVNALKSKGSKVKSGLVSDSGVTKD